MGLLLSLVWAGNACQTHARDPLLDHIVGKGEFILVALPDTQFYSESYPEIFRCQTNWIARVASDLNVRFVVHLGDLTNDNSPGEWSVAHDAMSRLDGHVPYAVVAGNHDLGPHGSAAIRDSTLFDEYFPLGEVAQMPWYGGSESGTRDNAYYFLDVGDQKLLVLCLEFGPRDEVLAWANRVVTDFSDRSVIVVTHCYMNWDDTRVGDEDEYNPHTYGCGGNTGEQIWDKFVSLHSNILLVLSGHILNDGVGRLTSTGIRGNTVHQLLSNYQTLPDGGEGWLRILRFRPSDQCIDVITYSPWLDRYASDSQNQFTLTWDKLAS